MKLKIDNSYTTVADATSTETKVLESILTYKDETKEKEKVALIIQFQKAMKYGQQRKAAYLQKAIKDLGPIEVCLFKENQFPSGLLFKVTQALNRGLENAKYEGRIRPYEIEDIRAQPESYQTFRWSNQPPRPRPYQEDCIAIGAQKGRGTFEVCVGGGKTLIASFLIKGAGVNTLFVVPSVALSEQTKHVFELYFGKDKVQQVNTKDIKSKKKLKPIRISTVQTLASLQKQGLIHKIISDVDMLMIDEAHHGASDSYTKLLKDLNHVYYRYNFSGTYTRNDSKIMELWGVCGEKLYKYNAALAIKEGYLTPVNFEVVNLRGKSGANYHKEYTDNYGGKEFLDAVVKEVKSISKDKSILILVDRKDAVGKQIHDWLKVNKIDSAYMTGDNDKKDVSKAIEAFNDKEIQILIGSTVLGEGIDVRSTDTLILARGGKSDIAITQAIGRAVRLYPGKKEAKVIDFNFQNSNWLHKHTALRIENYAEEFAGKIIWK